MLCPLCKDAELNIEMEEIRYEESGFSNILLRGVEVGRCPACEAQLASIPKMTQLHQRLIETPIDLDARHSLALSFSSGEWLVV